MGSKQHQPSIRYRIVPADPAAHLFEVSVEVDDPATDGQRFALPAWIPGSYMIREFARQLGEIDASAGGRPVALRKIDKHTWQADPVDSTLRLCYQVYAWDLSVRAAHLDTTHGFYNASSVFLRVLGRENEACAVHIAPPRWPKDGVQPDWQVATTLPVSGARPWGFGDYRASDYDELADHPVEMGSFSHRRFDAAGIAHDLVISGRHDADLDRLAKDLSSICEAQIQLFEPEARTAPFDRYLFLTMAVGEGYGGLEHRTSTALICERSDLPHPGMSGLPDGYRRFLGLASHEYFHSWLVKRIKPAAFVPYNLDRENYTRLLWIFEGFTSYYDDLMLLRAGVIGLPDYLKALSGLISQVLRGPGRLVQSLEASSFDAWIKFYRQDENSPNTVVSYYAKGALVALCLDLELRARTAGHHSLDDVIRCLWRRFGTSGPDLHQGLQEDGFASIISEATGLTLGPLLEAWTQGTGELPLQDQLARAGLTLTLKPAGEGAASIGARLSTRQGDLTITTALSGRAAMQAGLSAGDVIVAADGLRMDEKALKLLLSRRRPGDIIRFHVFRRDELMVHDVRLEAGEATEATLSLDDQAADPALRLRRGWLGHHAP